MNKFSYIELAVLQMLEGGELHGYAMSAKMQAYSNGDLSLPAGSLYPALHKLERSNLIRSNLERIGGRARRIYAITPKGLEVLEREIRSWKVIVKTMDALLGAS
jgi:PadR family transcriptional regulator, regulatory protein PadR